MAMLACSLFIQILPVQKAINCGTNTLPILCQDLTGGAECCDLGQLIHPAQYFQSDQRDPHDDLWGSVDL
jgi:hypothetical protein